MHEISNYTKMYTINKAMKILGSSRIYKKTRYLLEVRKIFKDFTTPVFIRILRLAEILAFL